MPKSLHIVFLTQWYPHPEDIQNGTFIKHQAVGLAKKHRVTVLWVGADASLKEVETQRQQEAEGALCEIRVRYPKKKKALGRAAAWKKAFTEVDSPDVVHLNVLDRDFPAWELWLKKIRKPFIIHEHASLYFRGYRKDAIWHSSRKRLIRNAFRVCPVSRGLEFAMKEKGLDGNYEVVPNILAVPPLLKRKPRSEIMKLVSIGDLVNAVKQYDEVIKALSEVEGPWEYTIIGDGPDREELEQLANKLFLNDPNRMVHFTGRLGQSEVQKELPKHHICLINSAYETFGLVGLEALNAGVVVLSTPVGIISEYLREGQNGYFLEDSSSIARTIGLAWSSYEELDYELLSGKERNSLSIQAYNDRIQNIYGHLGLFVD